MIAVLGWCDGFGNDTFVAGIFPNLTEAKKFATDRNSKAIFDSDAYRWVKFNYGRVDFDWYDAHEFKKKKGKKNNEHH